MAIVNSLQSPRFCGIRTFMRMPYQQTPENADVAVVGVPYDCGVSYRPGTRFGPAALREASTILKPYCSVLDADINECLSVVDCGDIDTIPGYIEESLDAIRDGLVPFFKSNAIPVILGGDHSETLGVLRACYQAHGPVALVHFDAHSDTISGYYGKPYNHGTPFYWALKEKLIIPELSTQIGIRGPLYSRDALSFAKSEGLNIVMGEQLHRRGIQSVIDEVLERVGDTPAFLTFDIDFLDASVVPGTGTPEVEGFTTYEGLTMVRAICSQLNMVGMDLVEVLPDKDIAGITSLAGASVCHAFMAALAKRRGPKKAS